MRDPQARTTVHYSGQRLAASNPRLLVQDTADLYDHGAFQEVRAWPAWRSVRRCSVASFMRMRLPASPFFTVSVRCVRFEPPVPLPEREASYAPNAVPRQLRLWQRVEGLNLLLPPTRVRGAGSGIRRCERIPRTVFSGRTHAGPRVRIRPSSSGESANFRSLVTPSGLC
jgi:hypothetical protein